jgi:hypothetical protein
LIFVGSSQCDAPELTPSGAGVIPSAEELAGSVDSCANAVLPMLKPIKAANALTVFIL